MLLWCLLRIGYSQDRLSGNSVVLPWKKGPIFKVNQPSGLVMTTWCWFYRKKAHSSVRQDCFISLTIGYLCLAFRLETREAALMLPLCCPGVSIRHHLFPREISICSAWFLLFYLVLHEIPHFLQPRKSDKSLIKYNNCLCVCVQYHVRVVGFEGITFGVYPVISFLDISASWVIITAVCLRKCKII